MIKPLNPHYSMETIPTIYDEEAMTALELAGRTTAKVNEVVETVNKTLKELPGEIEAGVSGALEEHIASGAFEEQLDSFVGGINRRLDNLILSSGDSTPEVADIRVGHDGTTYATAGDAVRGAMRRLVMSMTNPTHPGEDDGVMIGYYSNVNGEILNTDGYLRTKFLYPCKPGVLLKTLIQDGKEYEANTVYVCCYTINLHFLGWFRLGAGVTLPGTAFVGISIKDGGRSPDGSELVMMEIPAVTGYEVDFTKEKSCQVVWNAFMSGVGNITGTEDYNVVNFKTEGIKSIYTNKTLVYNTIFFDKENKVISNGATYTTEGLGRRYNVPDNAVWVSMNVPTAHVDENENFLTYIALERLDPDSNDLNGKRVTMIGDSLVWLDGHEGDPSVRGAMVGIQAQLRKRGAIVNTMGFSGASYASSTNEGGVMGSLVSAGIHPSDYPAYNIPDSDVLVFMFGTNDIRLGIPAGGPGDETNIKTFYGAICGTPAPLREQLVKCPVYFTTCLYSESEARPMDKVLEYHNATIQACNASGFGVIDLLKDSGVNMNTLNQLTYDGTHPNLEGMKRLGRIIAKRLEETL